MRVWWLTNLRNFVGKEQGCADIVVQVGGMRVDVEADEVCFRAKAAHCEDGRMGALWLRYVCFAQRGSGQHVLSYLGRRIFANAGQRGGGQLTYEAIHNAACCGDHLASREGSVAHTVSAQAYISLDKEAPSLEAPPADVQEAMAPGQPHSDLHGT